MAKVLFPLLMLLAVSYVSAQPYRLTGTVADSETGLPLRGVSVRLQQLSDTTKVWGTVTDTAGRYVFGNLPADSFRLFISRTGYAITMRRISSLTADTDIGKTSIASTERVLSEVVITSRIPPVTQKADRYNIMPASSR